MQSNWPHLRCHWPHLRCITLVAVVWAAILTANFTTTVNHGAVGHHIRLDTWHWWSHTRILAYISLSWTMSTRYVISWKLGLDCSWPRPLASMELMSSRARGQSTAPIAEVKLTTSPLPSGSSSNLQWKIEAKLLQIHQALFTATPYLETCVTRLKKNLLAMGNWECMKNTYHAILGHRSWGQEHAQYIHSFFPKTASLRCTYHAVVPRYRDDNKTSTNSINSHCLKFPPILALTTTSLFANQVSQRCQGFSSKFLPYLQVLMFSRCMSMFWFFLGVYSLAAFGWSSFAKHRMGLLPAKTLASKEYEALSTCTSCQSFVSRSGQNAGHSATSGILNF